MEAAESDDCPDAWGPLMAAAQAGDQASYGRLLMAIAPLVRRVVRRRWLHADTSEVEDIIQEVLLSVHAVRHTYDPARPFQPWLMAIVQHRVADASRGRTRRGRHETPEASFANGLPDAAAPEPEDTPGDPQQLRRALADLPEGQRRAIELVKLEERSLKDAAAATGSSVGAMKTAVHRGIKALRVAMEGWK